MITIKGKIEIYTSYEIRGKASYAQIRYEDQDLKTMKAMGKGVPMWTNQNRLKYRIGELEIYAK